eukprot:TRINITY_DN52_c0_g1_i2.p1 TRINITY_DN52_c0_g1~~TRINITY_DN52_c0_g1_i2.p1  ORF type:complete len:525 (-),score=127.01 TRINITY_DN52_c0_g1_i2:119-1540(-)
MASGKSVIVIGGGLAGLSAAVRATELGFPVTLLEKEGRIGGNSGKATSGINACMTAPQEAADIEDSANLFGKDTLASGDGLALPHLVEKLAHESLAAFDWIVSFGPNLSQVTQLGGHSVPRTHKIPPRPDGRPVGVGYTIVKHLHDVVNKSTSASINVNSQVTDLLRDESGAITGVKFLRTPEEGAPVTEEINGVAVILATGGFGANRDLITHFRPDLATLATTNGPGSLGQGIALGSDVGGVEYEMEQIQVHPTSFVNPKEPEALSKFLAPEALRGFGGVLIDKSGKRFANELLRRDELSAEIKKNGNQAYIVLNQEALELFGIPNMGFYKFKGLVQQVEGYEALAEHIGCSLLDLEATFASYNVAMEAGKDEFGKSVFKVGFQPTDVFQVGLITPSIHYTMGGLLIDEKAQVLNKEGTPIPGLFAAGEVTGGVHGANRLGGNSLAECAVFGRIAAVSVAEYSEAEATKPEL